MGTLCNLPSLAFSFHLPSFSLKLPLPPVITISFTLPCMLD